MPYTNCSACGAKALVGATRCPRCQAPFVSYEINGERVPTVNCPNCGVQRPVAIGVCPNCLMSTAPSGRRLARGLILASLAIAALMAVGYTISRRAEGTHASSQPLPRTDDTSRSADSIGVPALSSDSLTPAAPAAEAKGLAAGQTPSAAPGITKLPEPVASNPTATTASSTPPASPTNVVKSTPLKPAPPPSVAVSDTGRWEYAVATTWVRVRSAPTRESDVLRMVDSAQRVRLGPPQNGWRPVRVGVDRGWVDPRLFTVVPAPKR
jgi:hypothetical protein